MAGLFITSASSSEENLCNWWVNSEGFADMNVSYYWSSTTHQVNPSHAWSVRISGGKKLADLKSNKYYVLPVRAGNLGGNQ